MWLLFLIWLKSPAEKCVKMPPLVEFCSNMKLCCIFIDMLPRIAHLQHSYYGICPLFMLAEGCPSFLNLFDHFKILDARKVIWSKFSTKDPKIVGTAVQYLVSRAAWLPGYVHPCVTCYITPYKVSYLMLHLFSECFEIKYVYKF